ncbi:MAG: phosphoribosyltransferase [Flavobacteriaceae bacterium]|jgi:pyrimidine operon attenuation protein / uracil phosphoribosyltransferase|nr:phosphoribosyltransferase [Flavobacteriaceae bacterium]MBT4112404.1 phosphoribosyltransferase [Flavobacteriaceae bacterium]MBT4614258.1 phosphoribosyltransferase [Flavobacteriaceae bacterium]MBT5246711.1 phosphoribosyltransferase [Flavobacteriaceae bacterium]MBT5649896.1 phosphoribosyltransferase [Flavobacteriaceae bacterium]
MEDKKVILNDDQIRSKLKRISYQILETNLQSSELIIAGIESNGYLIARELKKILNKLSNIEVILCKVKIDKKNPRKPIETSIGKEQYSNKSIVLVDDVLNSGSTLIYGVKHFLETELLQFKTAVLVNRNHKKFPVKADFKGISLSTSMQSQIMVEFKGSKIEALLV